MVSLGSLQTMVVGWMKCPCCRRTCRRDDSRSGVCSSTVDVARDAVEGFLVTDGAQVAEIADIAHGDLVHGNVVVLDGVHTERGT